MSYLRLIWSGLWRNPIRAALTFGSLTVAFLLFGLLNGINQGLDNVNDRFRLDRLYVMNKISMYGPLVVPMVVPQVEKIDGVADVAYWAYFVGYYQNPSIQLPIVAADVDRMFRLYPELRIRHEELQAMSRTKPGAIISRNLAHRFNWRIGDRVPLKSALWPLKDGSDVWLFDIVGIYAPAEASPALNDLFFINLSYFDDARAFGAGAVNLVIVRVDDARKAGAIAKAIDAIFEPSPFQTRTRSENAYAAVQWRQLQDLRLIANAIIGAVVFTLVLVTASTMRQSVRQRFVEFAILMTVGFAPMQIALMVLIEALLLCLLACVLGMLVAAIAFPSIAELFGSMKLQPEVLAFTVLLAIFIAVASAALPALRASRLSIVDALAGRGA